MTCRQLVAHYMIWVVQGLLNTAVSLYTSAKTYQGAYSANIRANVCNTQFGRSPMRPMGASLGFSGQCRGPYDAYNGSALAWRALLLIILTCSAMDTAGYCTKTDLPFQLGFIASLFAKETWLESYRGFREGTMPKACLVCYAIFEQPCSSNR